MRCKIRERVRKTPLERYDWWHAAEPAFIAMMIGRYLNDGGGKEPPSVEETLRFIALLAPVKQYRRLAEVTAIVEMVDKARRKRNEYSIRNKES